IVALLTVVPAPSLALYVGALKLSVPGAGAVQSTASIGVVLPPSSDESNSQLVVPLGRVTTQPRLGVLVDQACTELVTLKLRNPSPSAGLSVLSGMDTALTSLVWTPPPSEFQVLEAWFQSTIIRFRKTRSVLAVPTLTVRAAALILAPTGIWVAAVPKMLSKR